MTTRASRGSATGSTTDEGWAKYNRHYWLRDYRGFLEFFFGEIFTEPHSTKQIEDCVAWGLDTTPETLIARPSGDELELADQEQAEALCRARRVPRRRGPRRRRRIVRVRARRGASPS